MRFLAFVGFRCALPNLRRNTTLEGRDSEIAPTLEGRDSEIAPTEET